MPEIHWHESSETSTSIRGLCLERRLPEMAAARGLIWVVDESGEDYLYPRDCFRPIKFFARV